MILLYEYRLACHDCTHFHQCVVPIIEGPCSEDVRLRGTSSGIVDVFLSGEWVAVANSCGAWQLESSQVICRELGYTKNSYIL